MEVRPAQPSVTPATSTLLSAVDEQWADNAFKPAHTTVASFEANSAASIMIRTLTDLLCQADPLVRERTFDELWHSNAVIYAGEDARAGRAAVLEIAYRFNQRMAGLCCAPASPVSGSDDLYMLRWAAHRVGRPVATGCCIGMLVRDRIHSFYMIED